MKRMSDLESNAFVLYSREKCPLCEKAKQILEESKFESGIVYTEIDIYSDDDLLEKVRAYDSCYRMER